MSWLEIDGDTIVGVHSEEGTSPLQWVAYEGTASPGDRWTDNKVIPAVDDTPPEEVRRRAARLRISEVYPEWRQLNILRSGTRKEIARMGKFLDACRAWSNDPNAPEEALAAIQP